MQRTENGTIFKIGKYSSESSDSEEEDNALVSLKDDEENELIALDDDDEKDHSTELYFAGSSGVRPDGSEYVRVVPDKYSDESGNNFMHYVIGEYAVEEKDRKGEPTGVFKFNKKETSNLSREMIQKVKQLDGDKLNEYMDQ